MKVKQSKAKKILGLKINIFLEALIWYWRRFYNATHFHESWVLAACFFWFCDFPILWFCPGDSWRLNNLILVSTVDLVFRENWFVSNCCNYMRPVNIIVNNENLINFVLIKVENVKFKINMVDNQTVGIIIEKFKSWFICSQAQMEGLLLQMNPFVGSIQNQGFNKIQTRSWRSDFSSHTLWFLNLHWLLLGTCVTNQMVFIKSPQTVHSVICNC